VDVKPVIPRERAHQDVDSALQNYLSEAAAPIALGFIYSLEAAYTHIARHPVSGSLRYADALNLPGLRYWQLPTYPFLIFYLQRVSHIDVWRVLNAKRYIPAWFQEKHSP
jgi:toxin ParE1/3/4